MRRMSGDCLNFERGESEMSNVFLPRNKTVKITQGVTDVGWVFTNDCGNTFTYLKAAANMFGAMRFQLVAVGNAWAQTTYEGWVTQVRNEDFAAETKRYGVGPCAALNPQPWAAGLADISTPEEDPDSRNTGFTCHDNGWYKVERTVGDTTTPVGWLEAVKRNVDTAAPAMTVREGWCFLDDQSGQWTGGAYFTVTRQGQPTETFGNFLREVASHRRKFTSTVVYQNIKP